MASPNPLFLNAPVRHPLFSGLQRRSERLGALLVSAGYIDRAILRKALVRKSNSRARIGEVLTQSGLVSEGTIADALALQWNLGRVDLRAHPPDHRLMNAMDIRACLRVGCVPWRMLNGVCIIAASDPTRAEDAVIACNLPHARVAIAVALWDEVREAIVARHAPRLEKEARTACPEHMSCRNWTGRHITRAAGIVVALCLAALILAPTLMIWLFLGWILVFNALTSAVRFLSAIAILRPKPPKPHRSADIAVLADHRVLPKVSIMVPLHREDLVLPALMGHINAMDYPRELLDIKLLVEEDDTITQNAIKSGGFQHQADVIIVPRNRLTTKPRALNYGINFCRGEIIGILDAEDRPATDQVRVVVDHLFTAPPDVAAVQGILDFYNCDRNWMSRCFTIEYSMWFRVLLAGHRMLDLPIPLGGTTVYFRRKAIEDLGGWDAHNVTEDADLGIRIARRGMKTEMIPTITWEEANCSFVPWIKQRSRWLKGYLISWAVHMRHPVKLYQELGFWRFWSVQTTFLGGVTAYLSIPFLWITGITLLGFGLTKILTAPAWIWALVFGSMILGNIATLICAVAALRNRGKRHLITWLPTMPIYWAIGMFATAKAFAETLTKPFYWDKTVHGTQSDQDTTKVTAPNSPIDNTSFV